MSARQDGQPKSWRYSSSSASSGRSAGRTVRGRRIVWTGLLILAMVAGAAFAYWLLTRRFQHTRVVYMATTSKTYTSEPEHPYTLPPLRFNSETIAPLSQHQSNELEVEALPDAFSNAENLTSAILDAIDSLERDDALIVWIRAKGMSLAGKPYLLSGSYDLPTRPEDLDDPQGAVAWQVLVQAVQQWSGTSLILLDWGNQLADARAGQWENDFLALAAQEIAQAPERVHCLVSHLPGQISLDSLAESQTLFGRSCAEALVGPRRLPADYQALVSSQDSVLLGDLAEYVIRRVMADSGLRQTPWLAHGGSGWADGNSLVWDQQTTLPLLKLGRDLRPLRWPPLESEAAPGESEAGGSSDDASPRPLAAEVALTRSEWPTSTLWSALDKWTTASADLGGWSLETIAPLNRRRFATLTADLEARWFAGEDFRGGTSLGRLMSDTDQLLREIQSAAQEITRSVSGSRFAAIESQRPADVPEDQFAAWQQHIQAIHAARRLALRLSDCVNLADRLSSLEGASADFRESVREAIDAQRIFNAAFSSAFPLVESTGISGSQNWADLTEGLDAAYQQLSQQLDELLREVLAEPLGNQAIGEMLLRYCWLSQPQRESLLQSALLSRRTAETDIFWPEKQLSQLVPPEPQVHGYPSVAETLWPELLASTNSGLSERTERAVLASMTTHASKLLNQIEFAENEWYVADGRDLCQKQNGWPVVWQMPKLLPVPQAAPQWQLTWHLPEPVGIQRSGSEFVLASSTQPASLDIRLNRRGNADPIRAIRAQASGVLIRLRATNQGQEREWQSELQCTASDLLKAADISGQTWYLPLELKGLGDGNPLRDPQVQIVVDAGKHAPAPESVVCRLPIPTPVACDVQQLIRRNSRDVWESCDQNADVFTVRPMAGRLSRLRLVLSNLDHESQEATIQLFAVPPLGSQFLKGRLNLQPGGVPSILQDRSLLRFEQIAISKSVTLEAKQQDVVIDFSAGDRGETQSSNGYFGR